MSTYQKLRSKANTSNAHTLTWHAEADGVVLTDSFTGAVTMIPRDVMELMHAAMLRAHRAAQDAEGKIWHGAAR